MSNYREGENPARWRDNLEQLLLWLSEAHKVSSITRRRGRTEKVQDAGVFRLPTGSREPVDYE